jgi:3-hydroxyisobutyrate dehydrogenase
MRVAFLGLGRIGAVMAANIVAGGHTVTVWNRSPGRARDLVDAGAREGEDVTDTVRDADAVMLSLFDATSVHDILGDVILAARPGTLVINLTTVGAADARDIASAAVVAGMRYLDAPVVGSVAPARQGKLLILVGSSNTDAAAAAPLLDLLGTTRRTGDVGTASALKVVANLALALATASLAEALRLGDDQGLDHSLVLEILFNGPPGQIAAYKREMITSGEFQPAAFTLEALRKDVRLALDAAHADLPLTATTDQIIQHLLEAGHAGDDFAVLASPRAHAAARRATP